MKNNLYKFRPVILGSDITAYSIARSFHQEYGIKSLAIGMSDSGYVHSSSFIENVTCHNLDDPEIAVEQLIKIGEEYGDTKLILFGCGDWYVRIIIENKDRLNPYYIIPYIDKELLDRLVLKDSFYELCEKTGLDHPSTVVYHCNQDEAPKLTFNFPVIVKPANSAKYHYAKFEGKKKVYRCDTEEDLINVLATVDASSYDGNLLIQDMIPGDDSYMHVLTCYCDQQSKVRFAALGHTLIEDPTPTAIGNPVAIVNEVNQEIVDAASHLLEQIGYVGFANFDLKYDRRDGKYKFFEINVRLGRSNFYVTGSGFNHVKWIVDEYIFDNLPEYTVADRECLYSVVPMQVIKKYVSDGQLREHALELWKKGQVARPLFYKGEKSFLSKYYAYMNYFHYIRKFKRYA